MDTGFDKIIQVIALYFALLIAFPTVLAIGLVVLAPRKDKGKVAAGLLIFVLALVVVYRLGHGSSKKQSDELINQQEYEETQEEPLPETENP